MKTSLFVIGVGRSGTTLLQSMLHAHSQIYFNRETHFVKRYLDDEIKKGGYDLNEVKKKMDQILGDPSYKEFHVDWEQIKLETIESVQNNLYLPVFFNLLFGWDKSVQYIGDKDPLNMNYLSTIYKAYPDAKVVQIIRDPRDVVASRMKSGWGRGRSLIWHASEYQYSLKRARETGNALFGKNYTEVRYEDLLLNTETELSKLCLFLNLTFESQMLNHFENASKLIRKEELDWKSNVLKPVDQSKIGQWKQDLKKSQLIKVESMLSKLMRELKYCPESTPNLFQKVISKFQLNSVWILFKIKFG